MNKPKNSFVQVLKMFRKSTEQILDLFKCFLVPFRGGWLAVSWPAEITDYRAKNTSNSAV